MATSFGPLLSALRQRAASHSSAVESGPPETASTSTGNCSRPEKSCLASDCETDDASAVATLLFLGDVALHLRRGLRIFASDLGERGAGRLLLMQRRERLAEAQKRLRRLAGVLVFRRHRQEGFRRLTITLLLELALAEPVLGVGQELVVRVLGHEILEGLRRQRIILAQHIAVGEVVF